MRDVAVAAGLLLVQRALGAPGVPCWFAWVSLPAVWLAVRSLRGRPPSAWGGLALGLGWDLLLEPVVGPGAIAWSAAAVLLGVLARVVSARSMPVWAAAGAVTVLAVHTVRLAALAPLGVGAAAPWAEVAGGAALVAVICAGARALERLDPAGRWRRARARRLR